MSLDITFKLESYEWHTIGARKTINMTITYSFRRWQLYILV